MKKVIVIGGGAAGMMAAISSSKQGNQVVLIEKNEKLGKKIYITGKGRCNLTNYCEKEEFFKNVVRNQKFMYSPYSAFSSQDVYNFFEQNGLKLKIERGNRVFPESDKASDVTKTLEKVLIKSGVDIHLNEKVLSLDCDSFVKGVKTDKTYYPCDKVIVCTGGISYPLTGSDGDGYKFAENLGIEKTETVPALVGIELKGNDFALVQGLSLKNVGLKCFVGGKNVYSDFGEMLFTHFGVSGPIVLSCSSTINRLDLSDAYISIDLKPALDDKTLNNRLLRDFQTFSNKDLSNMMTGLVPKSLVLVVLSKARVSPKKCCEITKEERSRLLFTLKNLTFPISRLRPIEEGIVTSGGISVKEINPKTMESRAIKGLFFAGEVLDVDAFTGGFNLQIAFSTGYTSGLDL